MSFSDEMICRNDLALDVHELIHDLAYDHEGRDRESYKKRAQEILTRQARLMPPIPHETITDPAEIVKGLSIAAEVCGALEDKAPSYRWGAHVLSDRIADFLDRQYSKTGEAFYALLTLVIVMARDCHTTLEPKQKTRTPGRVN